MSDATGKAGLRGVLARNLFLENFVSGLKLMLRERITAISFFFIVFFLLLGLFGPTIAPYEFDERIRSEDGGLERTAAPSMEHPLGTDNQAYDVFSRILYGAQPTMIAGLLGGALIISIGTIIGVTAGYFGGRIDSVLMRFTDLMYGVPTLPFAIVIVAFFEVGFIESVVIIGVILWRASARVLRSQVMQIKERPFILSAKASGAGPFRIIVKHIIPNISTMIVFFFALGIGISIILQASLAFLGVGNPFLPSWGVIIRNAFNSGLLSTAWWWSIPPGILISLVVMFTFMFGRGYEQISGQADDEAFVQGGG